jgi:hypothetical protein
VPDDLSPKRLVPPHTHAVSDAHNTVQQWRYLRRPPAATREGQAVGSQGARRVQPWHSLVPLVAFVALAAPLPDGSLEVPSENRATKGHGTYGVALRALLALGALEQ